MKKKELLKEIIELKERVEILESEMLNKRQERDDLCGLDKIDFDKLGKLIALPDGKEPECDGGHQFPMHYYSPDGKYPCTKCGKVVQCMFVTYETL